ncbi:hypothetical protein S40293_10012 [Stachybotrys chartarum IBT 40293]|nr:hypothetical protein S40293_10012 [Stachybotrys chartarum IBT 40293]
MGESDVIDLVAEPLQRNSTDLDEVGRITRVKDADKDDNDSDDLTTVEDPSKKKATKNPINWVKNKYREARGDRHSLDGSSLAFDSRQQSFRQSMNLQLDSDDEPGTTHGPKDGHEKRNAAILEQIQHLQQQLLDLERQALPETRAEDHEAVWERNLMRIGPEEERSRWHAEKKLRQSTLLMNNNSYDRGSDWMRKVDGELNRKLGDDIRYNERLLKLRKQWERKRGLDDRIQRSRFMSSDTSGDDGDLTTVYDSDDLRRDFHDRRRLLRDNFEHDERKLEMEFEYRERMHHRKANVARDRRHFPRVRPDRSPSLPLSGPPEPREDAEEAPEAPTVIPSAKSDLKRVQWTEFKFLQSKDQENSSAIDVLMGEPILEPEDRHYRRQRGHEKVNDHRQNQATLDKKNVYRQGSSLPERLRINSRELIAILTKIHGSDIRGAEAAFTSDESAILLLRPFRVLMYYDQAIRAWHSKLRKKFSDNALAASESEEIRGSKGGPPAQSTEPIEPVKSVSASAEDEQGGQQQETEFQPEEQSEIAQDDAKEDEAEDDSNSRVALAHLDVLLEFMDKDMKSRIDLVRGPGTCEKVVFSDLWHLFRPGDFVIRNDGKQAFRVLRTEGIPHQVNDIYNGWSFRQLTNNEETPFSIHCIYVDFDGKEFGPIMETFPIKRFEKEKSVTSLEIYPLRYYRLPQPKEPSAEEQTTEQRLWKYLVERGRKFLQACSVSVGAFRPMYYAGPAIVPSEEVESQVVVDFEAALAVESQKKWEPALEVLIGQGSEEEETAPKTKHKCLQECCRTEVVHDDSFVEKKTNEEFMSGMLPTRREELPSVALFPRQLDTKAPDVSLSEEELVIMSYRVMGFVMRNRTWGKGLILLLHGAPGVGKTSTAEGIAEKFNKPLFQLTCGDLGTTAKEVDDSLAKNFALANRWGCVLLLDEADVFLAQRTRDDFVRNGLVAVFLRVLEYYAGILFLTTNRVGDFDEAFSSRIHISLYYPELVEEYALEVFKVNLDLIERRFARKGRPFKTDRMKIGSFCERYWRDHPFDHWNGRQIRNACLTAVALAEFEAQGETANEILKPKAEVELKVSHFEKVSKAYLEFSEHMRNIYGTHAARRAKEAGLRAMWVDEKGKLVGTVGPKEAGILKGSRKNKFLQVASGQRGYGGSEPPQQRQPMPYRSGGSRVAGEQAYGREPQGYYYGPEQHYEEYSSNLPS